MSIWSHIFCANESINEYNIVQCRITGYYVGAYFNILRSGDNLGLGAGHKQFRSNFTIQEKLLVHLASKNVSHQNFI